MGSWGRSGATAACALGAACYWAWSVATTLSGFLWPGADPALAWLVWLVNVVAHAAALLALATGSLSCTCARRPGRSAAVAAVLLCVGTACLFAGLSLNLGACAIGGALPSSLATALFGALWFAALAREGRAFARDAAIALSVIAGLVISLVIMGLPFPVSLAGVLVLPVVGLWVTRYALGWGETGDRKLPDADVAGFAVGRDEREDLVEGRPGSLATLLACCAIFAAASGFVTAGVVGGGQGDWMTILSSSIVLTSAGAALDLRLRGRGQYKLLGRFAAPLMAGGLLLASLVTDSSAALRVLTLSGYYLFLIFAYSEALAARDSMPVRRFALVTATVDVGLFLGSCAGMAVEGAVHVRVMGVVIAAINLLALLGVALFLRMVELRSIRLRIEAEESQARDESLQGRFVREGDSYVRLCRAFAARYGLSASEGRTLDLLVRGRSLKSIASEASLSYNTIKTHVSHIYQKCSVHSREELIVLFEQG